MDSEIIRLNILKEYDVNWSLEFIIRDYIQNYFDSTKEFPEKNFHNDVELEVDFNSKRCSVYGKIEFDWENLKYIGGTTKQDKNKFAGGFGEGFLIATLCLFKLKPDIKINQKVGNIELIPFIDSDGKRKELCFEKRELSENESIIGSKLTFSNCDTQFLRVFSNGKGYFNYPQNPLFKKLLYQDEKNGINIYSIDDRKGKIFYRFQDRGNIVAYSSKKTVPFAICYNFAHPEIPNTRDRIDLQQAEKNRIFEKTLNCIQDKNAIISIIDLCQPDWQEGNVVLNYTSNSASKLVNWDWSKNEVNPVLYEFPEHFIADDSRSRGYYSEDYEIKRIIEREGFQFCNDYMRYFGMPSFKKLAGIHRDKIKAEKFRSPTKFELEKYNLMYDFYDLITNKNEYRKPLSIFLSEIKKGEYAHNSIYLNENIFYSFSDFAATFLHEICHKRGSDDTSGFTDILTMLIQLLLQNPEMIIEYKRKWDNIHDEHIEHENIRVKEVLLMPLDVQYHKNGCSCNACEKRKYKSFGIGIFNSDTINTNNDFNLIDPLHIIYASSFNIAMEQAEIYCKRKKWIVQKKNDMINNLINSILQMKKEI